eukprot:98122_1
MNIIIIVVLLTWIRTNYGLYSFKDETYFQNALLVNGTLSLPSHDHIRNLSCNVALTEETNLTNNLHYYSLHLTQEMKHLYRAYFTITTCCKIAHNSIEQMYHHTFTTAYEQWTNDTGNYTEDDVYDDWCEYCNCDNTPKNITLSDIPFFDGYGCGVSHFCDDNSLDTVMYILSEKQGTITLLETADDSDEDVCQNSHKSMIDLSSYKNGDYIIAVGGFGDDKVGPYQMNLECVQFSRPIFDDQINPNRSSFANTEHTLECGSERYNQNNSLQHIVSYYTLNLTEDMNLPITITTCDPNVNRSHTTLYMVQERHIAINAWEYNILWMSSHSSLCPNGTASDIKIEAKNKLALGEYMIMVQNYWVNEETQFSIFVHCGPESKEIHETFYAVLTACLLFFAVLLVLYCVIRIRFFRQQREEFEAFLSHFGLRMHLNDLQSEVFLLKELQHLKQDELEEIATICGLDAKVGAQLVDAWKEYQNGTYPPPIKIVDSNLGHLESSGIRLSHIQSPHLSMGFVPLSNRDSTDDEAALNIDRPESHQMLIPEKTVVRIADTSTTPRIGSGENRVNLKVGDGSDRIERVITHVISICEDFNGLDVYQVLAVRARDAASFEPDLHYPFKHCLRCPRRIRYWKVMAIPHFYRTLSTVIVVFMLQTWGITVTLIALMFGIFETPKHAGEVSETLAWGGIGGCMVEHHWRSNMVLFNKTLAFFWCLYLSFSIRSKLRNITDSGLYKIFGVLEYDELDKISCADFVMMRWGQMINYYVSLVAIIGSFFIIYDTSSEDDEYRAGVAGVEMILNSIALFFIIEIDDQLVFVVDYEDIPKIWERFGDEYKRLRDNLIQEQQSAPENEKKKLSCAPTENKCCKACFQRQQFADVFSGFVTVSLYVVGAIGPFVVFFCW